MASNTFKISDKVQSKDTGTPSKVSLLGVTTKSTLLPAVLPPEHGDIALLDDRQELAYVLEGNTYSVHPNPTFIAGEDIPRGYAVAIATSDWATSKGSAGGSADAGRVFIATQSNTEKTVGIALNSAKYGNRVDVLDHGIFSYPVTFVFTGSGSTTSSILINGVPYALNVAGGSTAQDFVTAVFNAYWSAPQQNVYVTLPSSSGSVVSPTTGSITIYNSATGIVPSLSATVGPYTLSNTIYPFAVSDIGNTAYVAPFATPLTNYSQQFTTDRTLAASSSAPLIEIGIVVSQTSIFIDFEGDSRGAIGLSQTSITSGEPLQNDGKPILVSVGQDGQLYASDSRKASNNAFTYLGTIAGVGGYSFAVSYGSGGSANTATITVTGSGTLASQTTTILGRTITFTTEATANAVATRLSAQINADSGAGGLFTRFSSTPASNLVNLTQTLILNRNTPVGFLVGANSGFGASSTVPVGISGSVQKAGLVTTGFSGLLAGQPIYLDTLYTSPASTTFTQNPASKSFITDVTFPVGYAQSATSVYVEMGFASSSSDANPIGSVIGLSPTGLVDYGYLKANGTALNGLGTTALVTPTVQQNGTYDTSSLYSVIGTTFGGTVTYTVTYTSTTSGTFLINGQSYTISGSPASANAVATAIQTAYNLSTQTGITVTASTNTVLVANTTAVSQPIVSFSSVVGSTLAITAISYNLPNWTSPSGQIRYANFYVPNPVQAPLFRYDTGWNPWGTLFSGYGAGSTFTNPAFVQVPITSFGSDPQANDLFVEIFAQKAGVTRKIEQAPVVYNYTSGSVTYKRYGFQVSKDLAGFIKVEFADDGLAFYNLGQSAGTSGQYTVLDNTWQYRIFVYKTERYNKYYDYTSDQWLSQFKSLSLVDYTAPTSTQNAGIGGYFDRSATAPIHSTRLNYDGNLYANSFVASNGITVTAGGLTVSAGGLTITGATSLTGTLTVVGANLATFNGGITVNNTVGTFNAGLTVANTALQTTGASGTATFSALVTASAGITVNSVIGTFNAGVAVSGGTGSTFSLTATVPVNTTITTIVSSGTGSGMRGLVINAYGSSTTTNNIGLELLNGGIMVGTSSSFSNGTQVASGTGTIASITLGPSTGSITGTGNANAPGLFFNNNIMGASGQALGNAHFGGRLNSGGWGIGPYGNGTNNGPNGQPTNSAPYPIKIGTLTDITNGVFSGGAGPYLVVDGLWLPNSAGGGNIWIV